MINANNELRRVMVSLKDEATNLAHRSIDLIAEVSKRPEILELSKVAEVPVPVMAVRAYAIAVGAMIGTFPVNDAEQALIMALLNESYRGSK